MKDHSINEIRITNKSSVTFQIQRETHDDINILNDASTRQHVKSIQGTITWQGNDTHTEDYCVTALTSLDINTDTGNIK